MAEENKKFSAEEILRIAPRYKGKPENFKADSIGKKRFPPKSKQNRGPTSSVLAPPKFLEGNLNPTPQRNESIIAESIFGIDVSVTPIEPRQTFSSNYAKLPELARETFSNMSVDERLLDRILTVEEFSYYTTALLWIKLIDTKAKQGRVTLTSQEKDIRKAVSMIPFNVPQPIYTYLSQVGNVIDKMGKETEVEIPTLPVAVAQGLGGYHSDEINLQSHNLFEEIPSLGIAADVVMALTSQAENPVPNIRVGVPEGSRVNQNLVGSSHIIAPRRQEIRQRLNGFGITENAFPEYATHTRFSLKYIMSISDILNKIETYRIEKVVFQNLTISGGETQVIITRPIDGEELNIRWTDTTVQPTSAASESTAQMGASYVFGFQLYKENGNGDNDTQQMQRWTCLEPIPDTMAPWIAPAGWYANRNVRRNLPPGIGTERFRAIGKSQAITLSEVVRRMIKTSR